MVPQSTPLLVLPFVCHEMVNEVGVSEETVTEERTGVPVILTGTLFVFVGAALLVAVTVMEPRVGGAVRFPL